MKKLNFSVRINAPREKVWNVLWGDDTYLQWTKPFGEGGKVVTDNWKEGSKVLFLGADGSGMFSTVASNKPNEYMSFKHLGEMKEGKEQPASDWAGSMENYTLKDANGGTELLVDMDVAEEYEEMFSGIFPKALNIVKELSEN